MDSLPLMESMTDALARTSVASEGEAIRKIINIKHKHKYNGNAGLLLHNDDDDNNNNNNIVSFAKGPLLKEPQPLLANTNENEEIVAKLSPLQEFYKGTNIFVTGGTGFMGKILLEKLLRACPNLETIFLLVRDKKGKDIHARAEEIFDDQVFDLVRKSLPKFRHKIVLVPGDVSLAGLGLSLTDRQMLIDKVNIVFHAAATVRFDEKLSLALSINVEGVKSTLELCKRMKHLKSLVHVSTAYTNSFRPGAVDECFYRYPVKYEEVYQRVAKMSDKELEENTPKILGLWPNTYTFTKALAENYILDNCKGLPIGMFRPAIVTSTFKEPAVGWIDNLYGPTGVIAGAGTGLLRTLHCDERLHANVVPVDYCVNAILASAWDIANNCNERKEENMMIYNYVSNVENPLTWKKFCYLNRTYGFEYPFATATWYYTLTLNKSAFIHKLYSICYHYIPAIIVDGLSVCIGQKPRLLKMYQKIHKFSDVISYFCTHDWDFSNDNVQSLWRKLDTKDKGLFPFCMKDMDWVHYFTYYIKGMRTYLFKEQQTQEQAVKKWKRLYILHLLFKTTSIVSLSYAAWSLLYRLFFKAS